MLFIFSSQTGVMAVNSHTKTQCQTLRKHTMQTINHARYKMQLSYMY